MIFIYERIVFNAIQYQYLNNLSLISGLIEYIPRADGGGIMYVDPVLLVLVTCITWTTGGGIIYALDWWWRYHICSGLLVVVSYIL